MILVPLMNGCIGISNEWPIDTCTPHCTRQFQKGANKAFTHGCDVLEFFEQREADKMKQRLMEENNITQEQMNQIANQPMDLLAPRKNMGGMMDINNMMRPLRNN